MGFFFFVALRGLEETQFTSHASSSQTSSPVGTFYQSFRERRRDCSLHRALYEAALFQNKNAPPSTLLSIRQVFENCRTFSEDPKTIIDKTTEFIALTDWPVFSLSVRGRSLSVIGVARKKINPCLYYLWLTDIMFQLLSFLINLLSVFPNKSEPFPYVQSTIEAF